MKKYMLFLVFTCIPLISFCQDYVITVQGDTLKGKVKLMSMTPIDQVQVIVNKKKNNLDAVKARTVFFGNEVYHSVRYGQTQKFMKVIKYGFLSLYAFKSPNQNRYDGLLLVKKGGETLEVPNLGFKKIMMRFLVECETLSKEIEDEMLKRKDINDIIDKFNTCSTVKGNDPAVRLLASHQTDKKINELEAFRKKVDALEDFSAKKDVLDILGDIKEKLEKQEAIPSYLYGVLKTHLSNQPTTTEDLEKLIVLLSK